MEGDGEGTREGGREGGRERGGREGGRERGGREGGKEGIYTSLSRQRLPQSPLSSFPLELMGTAPAHDLSESLILICTDTGKYM